MDEPRSNSAETLRWVAAFGLVVSAFALASAAVELFPFWDLDPGRQWVPSTGYWPSGVLILSAVPMLAAALALLAAALDRESVLWGRALLGVAGGVGVIVHGMMHGGAGLEHLVYAGPWVGAMGAWIASAQLSQRPRFRRLLLALATGFVVVLLSKGVLQVFVEHPMTVANYEQNKASILASHGWAPGSANALAYERRLSQAEATGWFGLSNVYATFAAAGFAGLAAACVAAWRAGERRGLGLLAAGLGAIGAGAALGLSFSKGGAGAAGLALVAAGLLALLIRLRPGLAGRVTPWVGPVVIMGVLAMVAVRGLVGETIGERSVLFRSFYAVGALRIWGEHPLLGVGPAAFQDAYAAAKPAISTENVMSPHSVLLDWASTLGVFGLAWVGVLLWSARRLCGTAVSAVRANDEPGRHSSPSSAQSCRPTSTAAPKTASSGTRLGRVGRGPRETPPGGRADLRFLVLTALVVTVIAVFEERAFATPDVAVGRLVGLAGWIAVALGVHGLLARESVTKWLAVASGLALVAHAQIEVTPVWANSCVFFGLWVGAASEGGDQKARGGPVAAVAAAAGWLVLPAVLLALSLPRVLRWEHMLTKAAEIMRPVGELNGELEALAAGDPSAAAEQIASRLSDLLQRSVPARPEALVGGIALLRAGCIPDTADAMLDAVQARPGHDGTRAATGRLLLEEALLISRADSKQARAWMTQAVDLARAGTVVTPGSVGAWDWAAVTDERVAEVLATMPGGQADADELLRQAWGAWLEVDRLSPYAVRPAVRLMDLTPRVGRASEARKWAGEAMRRDGLCRLDPLAGLTDEERARAGRVAGGD